MVISRAISKTEPHLNAAAADDDDDETSVRRPTQTMFSRTFLTPRVLSRSFSTTPLPCAKHSKERLTEMLADLPPYPFPIKRTFKQHWFGLYGGKFKQFGNNVPESRYKTRRTWLPNVKQRKLYSDCLGRWVELKLAACVLRTVDKCGGLDNYLTGEKAARIKELGPFGWKLRWDIMSSKKYLQKRAAELEAMGLLEFDFEQQMKQQISAEKAENGAAVAAAEQEQALKQAIEEQVAEQKQPEVDAAGNVKL